MSDRDNQREFMARKRASERDVEIPKVANPNRRAKAEADVFLWLPTYLPEKFSNPFTQAQRELVLDILHRATYGGDQAEAAPRGGGKTTLTEGVVLYCIVRGILKFPLLIAATGPDSKRLLSNLKFEFEANEQLAADYPEICAPIRALEGAAQRANMQTVAGKRTLMAWKDDYVILPTVPGSAASGSVIACRGCDSAIRGVIYRGRRPDFVLIDDPETRESAESDIQIRKREAIIEQDVSGLGGPGKSIACVMLTTLMNQYCLSAKFTDPKQKPSWNGKRYRLLVQKPANEDMWEQYIELRRSGMEAGGDTDGREAHGFYLENRKAMNKGAVVSDSNRYLSGAAADGSQLEASALQHCYNIIADRGWDNFSTEFQNDPPKEEEAEDSGITATLVASRVNGLPRRVCPADTQALTAFVDLGKRRLHWCVAAWRGLWTGSVIDYGVNTVARANVDGVEEALLTALRDLRDQWYENPWATEDGEPRMPDCILVDAGNWNQAAYEFVRGAGKPWRASMGLARYRAVRHTTRDRKPGFEYYDSLQGRLWVVNMNTDYWKRRVHEGFMADPKPPDGEPRGSITLWGEEPREHRNAESGDFAHQIVAEVWRKQPFKEGKGAPEGWHKAHRDNHYLDCVAGAACAAAVAGFRPIVTPKKKRARVKLSELQQKKRGKPRASSVRRSKPRVVE